jgi:hypothetical protein
MGCQRLRLEVDDLRLRCGEDANLVDVAQWVEPFSDYGKPKVASLRAGRALFNWKSFDVWRPLCVWSNQLAIKAMREIDIEWKSCDQ